MVNFVLQLLKPRPTKIFRQSQRHPPKKAKAGGRYKFKPQAPAKSRRYEKRRQQLGAS
jgi:hypothetical protein